MKQEKQKPLAVIVTGARGGIGRAVVSAVEDLVPEAAVLATDQSSETGAVGEPGAAAATRQLDVTDEAAVSDFMREVGQRYALLALVNVAGVLATGRALEVDPEQTRRLFEVNALGVINASNAAAALMLEQSGDPRFADHANARSITTVASNAGAVPRAGFAAYGASKAAASSYTRSLGLELGPHGIRCNVVNPGTTLTPMVEELWGGADLSIAAVAGDPAAYRAGIPLGRVATPADIAATVAFLVSAAARHVSLQSITVDGGASQA